MNKIRFVEVKDQVLTARTFSLVSLEHPDSFNQKQSHHHRTPVRGHFRGRS